MIDCHFHLWTADNSTPEKRAQRADQVRQEMELQDVDRITLIGDVGTTIEQCRESNRVVAKYVEEHPDLFYGWARVDPRLGEEGVAEFRRAVREDGLVGLKHHFGSTPVNISEPEFFPLAEAAVEMDVPIISHVMHRLPEDHRDDSEAYTEDVTALAERYPDLQLITAHIVAGGDAEYRIKNIADHENVYVDISGSNCERHLVEMAAEYCGVDRLVFGTDTWFQPGVGKLEGLDLSPAERAEIAYNFESLVGDHVPNKYDPDELAERKTAARDRFAEIDQPREEEIIDANAFLGRWPFFPFEASPADVIGYMDEKGVDRALVSSTEAIWYRNAHRGNRDLAEAVAGYEDRLVPIATINPSYSAWRGDLEECDTEFGMQGVKLLPNYHDYDLADAETKALLSECAARDLPVIIVATLDDQRQRHPGVNLRGQEDGLKRTFLPDQVNSLIELLSDCPDTDVILADMWNQARRVKEDLHDVTPEGVRLDNEVRNGETYFIAGDLYMYFTHQLEAAAEDLGPDHLVTGPQLPFKIFESYYKYTDNLPLDESAKQAVRSENVAELIE